MFGPLLQYPSLKTVLLHMDANVRFQISVHMPSIRRVEKLVPLKINSLESDEGVTKVNDTSYRLGILRHCPEANAPRLTELEMERGSRFDFDECGFKFVSGASILLPGDASFQEETDVVLRYTEEDEKRLRRKLSGLAKALMILKEFESQGKDVKVYLRVLKAVPFARLSDEEQTVYYALRDDSENLLSRIDECRLELLPFECWRNNTKSPFTCYIQLSITKGSKTHVERFEYTKKLFEVWRHFHKVLFGGRTMPILVGEFLFKSFDGIYRLPVGFRLQVQNACFTPQTVAHKKFPLIVENWQSLNTVEINLENTVLTVDTFECQIVRNAGTLIISDITDFEFETLVPIVRRLPNHGIRIHVLCPCSPERQFTIIQAWLVGKRQVGASLRMNVKNFDTILEVQRLILIRYEGSKKTERCITAPLSNSTALETSYDQYQEEFQETSWMLKMEIVKV